MDENHQDKTGSNLIVTKDELWIPPLSAQDQKKVDRLRKKGMEAGKKWRWGFSDKTGWDWLQLLLQLLTALALPVALFIATQWFSTQQSAQQAEANSQQALNQQQETTYQAYLDRMSDLIENGKLADPQSSSAMRALARSQTLAALRRSDLTRKGYIVQFLADAGLLAQLEPIVNLRDADLSDADLLNANLLNAKLSDADLIGANLSGAILLNANLLNAYLSGAILRDANLSDADLSGAILSGAKLSDADLSGANLSDAIVTQEQLAKAKSLKDATMPDGSKHP
jgi:hypothetical protein